MQNSDPITTQSGLGLRETLFVFGEDDPTVDLAYDRYYTHAADLAKEHGISSLRFVNRKN